MNWLVYHIVSGQAFFTGVVLLIIAVLTASAIRPALRRVSLVTFLIGIIAIVASSTAIPYWLYGLATVVTLAWLICRNRKHWQRETARATIAVWLIAAGLELPYHFPPTLRPVEERSLAVIGDSVTAGVASGDGEVTWPQILAGEHGVQVQDISHVGETAASALRRAESQQITAPIVLIEIGGNDILGSTSSAEFATDLEALLAHLAALGRQLVMFELPLPPFHHEFGRIQRTLAARYNVHLIPKRIFLSVIASGEATLDSIHLSPAGHRRMADTVWKITGPAFDRDAPP